LERISIDGSEEVSAIATPGGAYVSVFAIRAATGAEHGSVGHAVEK